MHRSATAKFPDFHVSPVQQGGESRVEVDCRFPAEFVRWLHCVWPLCARMFFLIIGFCILC